MENIKLDFEQAKSKHLLFKSRLRSILYGADLDEAPVLSHYECAVGKWIYNHAMKAYGHVPEMQKLESVHADIHTKARELVKLYKDGKVEKARLGLTEVESIADNLVELLGQVEKKIETEPDLIENVNEYQGIDKSVVELNDLLKANEQLDRMIKDQSGNLIKERRILHDFFMQAPAVFAILRGPEHIFELANPSYCELIGNRNPYGLTVREALPELKGQGYYELLDNVFNTKEPFIGKEMPVTLERIKGKPEQIYVNFSYQAFTNSEGLTEGILVFAYDVTEAIVARRKIEENAGHIRFVFEAMPQKVSAADSKGNVDFLNQQWYAYTGLGYNDLRGLGAQKCIHPVDLEKTSNAWQNAIENGMEFESKRRIRRSDGEYRWHLTKTVPQKDVNGAILMWVETNTDIHDLVIVQDQLKSSYEDLEIKVKFRNLELERQNLELRKQVDQMAGK